MDRKLLVLAVALLAGCAHQSHVIVGIVRPPISPDAVQVYLTPPPNYEQVAIIDASSDGSFSFGDQKKMDVVIARMKVEAAKLGANGLLIQSTGEKHTGSIGFGSGSSSFNGNTAVGVGAGLSGSLTAKTGNGIAIYVANH